MTTQSSFYRASLFAVFVISGVVFAKPKVELNISAMKEVSQVVDGKKIVKLVEAKSTTPGDVVEYTLQYQNTGTEDATNAVVDDPIPAGTTYIENSASGPGSKISFSNDGGKSFAEPVKLSYEFKLPSGKTEKRIATPSEYTHIRWVVASIPPQSTGKLTFKVRIK